MHSRIGPRLQRLAPRSEKHARISSAPPCNLKKVTMEKTNLPREILLHIAQTLNLPLRGITAVLELLDDGGTVPFIARSRKKVTGTLDEVQFRNIEKKFVFFRDLRDR